MSLRPGIAGPATLEYRLENEMIADYVAARQSAGDSRPAQDIEMIFATVLGKKIRYAGEEI